MSKRKVNYVAQHFAPFLKCKCGKVSNITFRTANLCWDCYDKVKNQERTK